MEGFKIERRAAISSAAFFLALIVIVPLAQLLLPAERFAEAKRILELTRNVASAQVRTSYASAIARESVVAACARRYYQQFLTAALHKGSNRVFVGNDGWLFLEEDVKLCSGTAIPAESPSLAAITHYHQQAAARGIRLLVVPIPPTPVLYPEKVWPRYPSVGGPAWNDDYRTWIGALRKQGVHVVDLTDPLWQAKNHGVPVWVPHNTHWAPGGAAVAARTIAQQARPWLTQHARRPYKAERFRYDVPSDLANLLSLRDDPLFPPFHCGGERVFERTRLASADDHAPVLLLGDSFSALYSGSASETIAGADLGRHLMLELGMPVEVIAGYGLDPLKSRTELLHRPEALSHKKVLIWEFAARNLSHAAEWPEMALP